MFNQFLSAIKMKLLENIKYKISGLFWNYLPSAVQITISKIYAKIFDTKVSRLIIFPFCKIHSLSDSYLQQFVSPATKQRKYTSFQDFFTRQYHSKPYIQSKVIWPCEGYICEQGLFSELPVVSVKGEKRNIRTVFTQKNELIPDHYFFTNVFLHNQNYHRIHAPISGTIRRIERVAGDLTILRPWFYKTNEISKPALVNERMNINIEDESGEVWFLSLVGGMAVGTIQLMKNMKLNEFIQIGEEIALFQMGSTCCIASPIPLQKSNYLEEVTVFSEMPISKNQ